MFNTLENLLSQPVFNVPFKFQRNILRILYVITFGYSFAIPVIVLYMSDVLGATSSYFYLAIISSATGLIFGIPLGILAEKIDRKVLITLGLFFYSCTWFMYALIPGNMHLWVLAFIFKGLFSSICGPFPSVYLHDLMDKHGIGKDYPKEESLRSSFGTLTMVLVIFSSGYLYAIDPRIPFILNGAFMLVLAAAFILFMPSVKNIHHETQTEKLYHTPLKDIMSILKSDNGMVWLILAGGAWHTVTNFIVFVMQSYMVELSFSAMTISTIVSGIYLFRSIGSYATHKFLSYKHILAALILFALCLIGIGLSSSVWIIATIIFISSIFRNYTTTSYTIMTVTHATPQQKALTKSIQSFYGRLTGMIFTLGSGLFISYYGSAVALYAVAAYILIFVMLPWLIFIRKQKNKESMQ